MKYSGKNPSKSVGDRKFPRGNAGNFKFPTIKPHGNRFYKGDIMGNSKG